MRRFGILLVCVAGILALLLAGEWVYERPARPAILLDTYQEPGLLPLRALREGDGRVRLYRGTRTVAVLCGLGAQIVEARFTRRDGRLTFETRDADAMDYAHDVARLTAMPDPGRALSERILHPLWQGIGAPLSRRIAAMLPSAPPMVLYEGRRGDWITLSPMANRFYVNHGRDSGRGITIYDLKGAATNAIEPEGGRFPVLHDIDRHGRHLLVEMRDEQSKFADAVETPEIELPVTPDKIAIRDAANGQLLWSPDRTVVSGLGGAAATISDDLTIELDLSRTYNVSAASRMRLSMFAGDSAYDFTQPGDNVDEVIFDHGRYRLRTVRDGSAPMMAEIVRTQDDDVVSRFTLRGSFFAYEPFGNRLAVMGADNHIEIRRPTGIIARIPELTLGTEATIDFSQGGDWLLASSDEAQDIYDSMTGALLHRIAGSGVPYADTIEFAVKSLPYFAFPPLKSILTGLQPASATAHHCG